MYQLTVIPNSCSSVEFLVSRIIYGVKIAREIYTLKGISIYIEATSKVRRHQHKFQVAIILSNNNNKTIHVIANTFRQTGPLLDKKNKEKRSRTKTMRVHRKEIELNRC
jgi:hypothetical protein